MVRVTQEYTRREGSYKGSKSLHVAAPENNIYHLSSSVIYSPTFYVMLSVLFVSTTPLLSLLLWRWSREISSSNDGGGGRTIVVDVSVAEIKMVVEVRIAREISSINNFGDGMRTVVVAVGVAEIKVVVEVLIARGIRSSNQGYGGIRTVFVAEERWWC